MNIIEGIYNSFYASYGMQGVVIVVIGSILSLGLLGMGK